MYLITPAIKIDRFESAMAFLVSIPKKNMLVGIIMPPPPIPPALANAIEPMVKSDPM